MSFKNFFLIISIILITFPSLALAADIPSFFGFDTSSPQAWINSIYRYSLSLIVVLSMAGIVYGGIRYLTSVGNEESITSGKGAIIAALSGLAMALLSHMILRTLDPRLVELRLDMPEVVLPQANTVVNSSTTSTNPDPCVGIPTEDLFDERNDCTVRGGTDGNGCPGTCRQIEGQENLNGENTGEEETGTETDGEDSGEGEEGENIENTSDVAIDPERVGKWCCVGGTCDSEGVIRVARSYVGNCVGPCHCAWFVSNVLHEAGCIDRTMTGADGFENFLVGIGGNMVRETENRSGGAYQGGNMEGIEAGDIVFIDHPERGDTTNTHTGIYAGGGRIIHAGSSISGSPCVSRAPQCPDQGGSESQCSACNSGDSFFRGEGPWTGRFSRSGGDRCQDNQCVQEIGYRQAARAGSYSHPTHYVTLP